MRMERPVGIDYVRIGKRVRERRMEMKLTQEQLAERVDVSSSFIGHIERAEKIPSLDTMTKLSYAVNTTLDDLVCGVVTRCDREKCSLFGDIERLLRSFGL